jgi:hypothetical protein
MSPDSDIDLLVEFMPDAKVTLFGHFDAEQEMSNLAGRRSIWSRRLLYAGVCEARFWPRLPRV